MAKRFGGEWTKRKLDVIEKYLEAYLIALSKHRDYLSLGYVDAFAGEGSIQLATATGGDPGLLDEELRDEVKGLIQGSAARALALDPGFDGYVFIDTDPTAVAELEAMRSKHPNSEIRIVDEDANTYLARICRSVEWKERRAVVFLDPAGMQVEWDTLTALASTGAVDVWIWFPLGVVVNRMLSRSGEIDPTWKARLDRIFGTSDWRDAFYRTGVADTLFGQTEETRKVATPLRIAEYFIQRLGSIFPSVAPTPCIMRNSKNNPLYALCFASANPGKGGEIAVRIAGHLLKRA